ncbi:hypothetical protein GIB67_021352 [Kingdonia uniflora]|uniref:Uncharacterized protein n=1 Tax=Kingdonia uniflora TaxID=39325 RepID=A0A7J7MCW9_9MAGN|nr:hypothetical protein GIB67_021352 [Kingdonia uniflora]
MMGEIKSGGIAEARKGLEVGEEGDVDGRNKMREFEHIVRVDSFEVAEGSDPKNHMAMDMLMWSRIVRIVVIGSGECLIFAT